MRVSGVSPDNFTFPILNRAISSLQNEVRYGEMIHGIAFQMGFGIDLYFCNTLIEVYVKNCSIDSARRVFDEMPDRDLVTWTSMISGYVSNRNIEDSFRLFRRMRVEDFEPNLVTLMILLRACSLSKNVIQGRVLHGYVIKKRLEKSLSVHNSILTMYSKTGSFKDVEILFNEIEERDVVSWNIMMSTHSLEEDFSRIAKRFYEMQSEVIPMVETLTLAISAFAKSGNLLQGEKIHGYAVKTGLCDIVLQTSLIDFYAKCGEIEISTRLFTGFHQRNIITWSVMMSGYIQNGYFIEAIELFREMQISDYEPRVDVLRSLVLAYTHLGALQLGKGVHGFVLRNIVHSSKEDSSRAMETSILNMYAKCGSIVSARRCFDQMVIKDLVAWSSMIEGYSNHGCGFEALNFFDQMQEEGIKPNSITILSLLSAFSHSGLVNEGYKVFNHMSSSFGIRPDLNHYTCMVDLLGRSGRLQEALNIIEEMTVEPDSRIWGALLAASLVYSNTELGVYAAKNLLELEPDNADYRILMSNLHASAERWDEAENVRKVMSEKDVKKKKKKPGWSCIETRGGFHGFVAGDDSHPQVVEIYEILRCLSRTVEEFGSTCYSD